VWIFFFFFPYFFFEIKRKKENQCKEEVILGVGSFLSASRQGEEKLALLDLVFVFCRSKFFFTQPSQCERMIAQGQSGL